MRSLLVAACLAGLLPFSALAEDLTSCRKGWESTQAGDYSGAIALYDACIKTGELSPASLARTYRNIGITQHRAKRPLEAVAAYNKAIVLNPVDVVQDYINRGNAYDESNDLDKALADYAKALEIEPNDGEPYYNRGIAYEHNHMLDKAKAEFIAAYEHGLRTDLLYERLRVYGLPAAATPARVGSESRDAAAAFILTQTFIIGRTARDCFEALGRTDTPREFVTLWEKRNTKYFSAALTYMDRRLIEAESRSGAAARDDVETALNAAIAKDGTAAVADLFEKGEKREVCERVIGAMESGAFDIDSRSPIYGEVQALASYVGRQWAEPKK